MAKRSAKLEPPPTHTPGPWGWCGNTRNDEVCLATVRGGHNFVMAFRRWGMANAQPCFYVDGIRRDVGELVVYERHYRDDVMDIDHPDARLIAAAPELLEALRAVVASATPHPFDQPAMSQAWDVARAVLQRFREPASVDAVRLSTDEPGVTTREK